MQGYLILEVGLPEEETSDQPLFAALLEQIRERLGPDLKYVARVHVALGEDGLRTSVQSLLGEGEG